MDELKFIVEDQYVDIDTAATYVLDADDVAVGAGKTAVVTITSPTAGVTYTVSSRTFSIAKTATTATGPFVVEGTLADGTGAGANSIPFRFLVIVQDALTKEPTVRALIQSKDAAVRTLVPLYLKTTLTSSEKTTVLDLERKLEGLDRVMAHLHKVYAILR